MSKYTVSRDCELPPGYFYVVLNYCPAMPVVVIPAMIFVWKIA